MALLPGTRIGSYEVIAPLGAGGMGEVYRAHDTKLGRDVALKILPDAFARDAERLARFEREARTLATLNHPHIAHIYGVEDGQRFLAIPGRRAAPQFLEPVGHRGEHGNDALSFVHPMRHGLHGPADVITLLAPRQEIEGQRVWRP